MNPEPLEPGQHALRWGFLATGKIAVKFARELRDSGAGVLQAVGSRDRDRASAFAAEFGFPTAYGSYEELLADPEVEAVYISTHHPLHRQNSIAAAEAGKHILCEKPLAMNHREALEMVAAARLNGVFLMEAFMYRCHPGTGRILEVVRSGELGEIRLIRATFSFGAKYDPASRLFDKNLGGGSILDVGCYTISAARLIAGAANNLPFLEPESVQGAASFCESGADDLACATLRFPGGLLAQVSCGIGFPQVNGLIVQGTLGSLTVRDFWKPPHGLQIHTPDGILLREEPGIPTRFTYAWEAATVAQALPSLQSEFMTWEDSLGNMKALDAWRTSANLAYASD